MAQTLAADDRPGARRAEPSAICPRATRRRCRRAPTYADGDEPVRWIYSTSGHHVGPEGRAAHRRDPDRRWPGPGRRAAHDGRRRRVDRVPVRPHRRPRLPGHDADRRDAGGDRRGVHPRPGHRALPSPRRDHGRRRHRVLPDVPGRPAQAARRADHPHAARPVGRRRAACRPSCTGRSRRDGHQDLPRLRHDRDPDDHPGLAHRLRRPARPHRRPPGHGRRRAHRRRGRRRSLPPASTARSASRARW